MAGSVLGKAGVLAAALVCACGPHRAHPGPDTSSPEIRTDGSTTIITAAALQQQSRSLLDLLKARVPSITIVDNDPCPDIYLRGRSTIVTSSAPAIYVDGQRANNTCVLDMMDVQDLQRVEIYANGQPRGGYQADPYGVILIFLKTSD